ncbi:MAG: hypothetical protein CMI09_09170 [Oceanospirillaceae bacterium]|nr:hypothetical protein [Oceanospirillaceae bacterium]
MNEVQHNEESRMIIGLLADKEEIIREAINRKIGTDWVPEDLKGRCYITKSPNTYEVFYLDGEPLVRFEFEDMRFHHDFNKLPAHVVSAQIKYAFIGGQHQNGEQTTPI